MGFASSWLEKRAVFPKFISEKPAEDTAVIVVIPAFNETSILNLLDSLSDCRRPSCSTEIIVVINAPPGSSPEVAAVNEICADEIRVWSEKAGNSFFRVNIIRPDTYGFRDWGVGLARKTGMDEAVRRFDMLDDPEGVIACLDADCRVRKDYFTALYEDFYKRKERKACSIYFEHPLSGNEFPEKTYRLIAAYELHLRYFVRALAFTGHPFAFHTVGSSMGVKAHQYVKAGGMNRRQGGEDFYFIQKLIPAGGFFNLGSTVVYPSPRSSDRVPFGTGAAISSMMKYERDTFLSYDLSGFLDLKTMFALTGRIRPAGETETQNMFRDLPLSLRTFIGEQEWITKTGEIRSNTSTCETFTSRFFLWFNVFRVIKYLNGINEKFSVKKPVEEVAAQLLAIQRMTEVNNETFGLLGIYRQLDRET